MSTIIMRSAFISWGRSVPDNLALVEIDHAGATPRVITWADVMQTRRREQRRRLKEKLRFAPYRPHHVWTAYFDQDLFGGWHAFIEDFRGGGYRTWIDRDRAWLIPRLMKLFPIVLGGGGHSRGQDEGMWGEWKIEFARQFKRRMQCRQPLGKKAIWWNGWDEPRLSCPECGKGKA